MINSKIKLYFQNLFEYIYASFISRKKKINEDIYSYNIGFAILSYERPEYLKLCLSTLYKSDISNLNISFFIIDDGSLNKEVREIINQLPPSNFKVHRFFETKGKNCAGAAINRAIKIMLLSDRFDIIGWADPDCLFHPNWLIQTLKISLWAKNNHKHHLLGPFTSFNSSDYLFHQVKGIYTSPYGKYVVKRQAGMLNYFVFTQEWNKFGPFEESDNDETNMTSKLSKYFVRNISTETSYVEHIGQESILNSWRDVKVNRAVSGINLESVGWTDEILVYKKLGYYKNIVENVSFGGNVSSNVLLDVFIPCTEKDLTNLSLCISGIRKNLFHPIGSINVVSPFKKSIKELCDRLNVNFIDETTVLNIDKESFNYCLKGYNRNGWLYQQLLKYSFDEFTLNDNYFVIDSDTILIKPQKYEHNGKFLLQVSDEFHKPYFDVYNKITQLEPASLLSSVCHSMLFNKTILKELKLHISAINNKNWIDAVIENTDKSNLSGFSEYETYGLWTQSKFENLIYKEYFFNKFLNTKKIFDLNDLSNKYSLEFKSVSIHKYRKN